MGFVKRLVLNIHSSNFITRHYVNIGYYYFVPQLISHLSLFGPKEVKFTVITMCIITYVYPKLTPPPQRK